MARKVLIHGLAALAFATAASAEVPEGWHLARDGGACEVDNPQADGAMLTIAVMPPQHLLLLQHPSFPAEKQSHTVTLKFAGADPVTTEAMGSDHIYGFGITPEIGLGLRETGSLTATIDGKDFVFRFAHGDAAMDEAARCAGTKTLPEVWNNAPKPIPEAPGWMILEGIGGTNQCSVRRNSAEVNTSLALTKQGRLLLIAGRPDWAKWESELSATLAIDSGPADAVHAFGLQNLVMLAVTDPAMAAKLSNAKTLSWHLPWGDFKADVENLGPAEAALRRCDQNQVKAK